MLVRGKPRIVSAASATLVVLATVLTAASASARPPTDRDGICQNRACLVIVDTAEDSDGDGVIDVDEQTLGTDPKNPLSTPSAEKVFDSLLAGNLPSFYTDLTEVVVLPQYETDLGTLATGFGGFSVENNDSALLTGTLWEDIDGLQANGFDMSHGFTTVVNLLPTDLTIQQQTVLPGPAADMALYSAGSSGSGICCFGQYSTNAGKPVSEIVSGKTTSDGTHEPEYWYGPTTDYRDFQVNYTDGSKDVVQDSQQGANVGRSIDSYDSDGNLVQTSILDTKYSQDPDGTKHTDSRGTLNTYNSDGAMTSSTDISRQTSQSPDGTRQTNSTTTVTTYNADGDKTGSTVTSQQTKQSPDGSSSKTTNVKQYDADGKLVSETTTVEDVCPKGKSGCDGDSGGGGDKYVDPDAVFSSGITVPITADEMDLVVTRLNMVRTAGPDTGQTKVGDSQSVNPNVLAALNGFCAKTCTWLDYIDPDGVATIAVNTEPHVPNSAQPDYVPWLEDLNDISGGQAPVDNGDSTYQWPTWPPGP